MQEAVPIGTGAMAAIIGLPLPRIEELCNQYSTPENLAQPANINSPEQIVIAGHKAAVEEISDNAKRAGAKKSILLPVSAPFHCSLMKPAEIKLQKELEQTEFQDLSSPVVANCNAKPILKGEEAREALRRQVCSPVRWVETMRYLVEQGVQAAVEIGPGKVLSGLMRRFEKNVRCFQVHDRKTLEQTLVGLKQL